MPAAVDHRLRFGRVEISAGERLVRVDGRPAALGARAFDLLLALVERRDRVVGKQELLDLVWPDVVVEEHNITAQVSSLRKLLGPHIIATVPGRGYRFVATLEAATVAPPGREPGAPGPSHNLPEPRTRFVGREAALADLAALLARNRLLTLTGIGGCGKTRLACELARQRGVDFPDGVWFVDLAPLKDAARVASACAAVLRIADDSTALAPDGLAAHVAQRQMLIVLDNCEHVRAGAAALADALLARAGPSRILATSREALGVTGEQLYPVRSLGLPASADVDAVRAAESVRVFVDRARLALPDFAVDAGNAATVVEICARRDGIALAIELAAARVAMLSVEEIAARLHDRFRLLTGGGSAVPRQQTLQATMQWSYDLLTPAEQRMLCLLAVCAGGWTLASATALAEAADEYQTLAVLSALHDKSLIATQRGAGGKPRYRMLATVREYAQQRLAERGETDAAKRRHAEYHLALAEQVAPHLLGPQQSQWMAMLGDEQENLVAAFAWCSDERNAADAHWSLRLVAATQRYWLFSDVALGCRLGTTALQRDRDAADSTARYDALRGLAAMFMHRGRGDEGLPHARAALAIAQRLGDVERQAMALNAIGSCLRRQDDGDKALRHYERARDLALAHHHAAPLSAALNNIANIDFWHGRLDAAEQGLRQALRLSRGRGDVRSALIELDNLIRVLVAARRHDAARACALEAERLLRDVVEPAMKLEWIEVSAGLASSQGAHEIAARLWGFASQRFLAAGYRHPPQDEAQLAQWSARTRQALGDEAFDRAFAAGAALDLETAMQELREWLGCERSSSGRDRG